MSHSCRHTHRRKFPRPHPSPSHAKNPAPRSTAHTSSTHNQHGYNYTQVVLFRARKPKPVPSPPPQIWLSQKHHEQKPAPPLKRGHILCWSQSHTPKWNHERKQTSSLDNNHNGPPNTYSSETLSWALTPNLDLLEYIQTVLHKRLHLYRNMKHVWNICVNTDQTTSIQHCLMSTSNNASSLQRHWSRILTLWFFCRFLTGKVNKDTVNYSQQNASWILKKGVFYLDTRYVPYLLCVYQSMLVCCRISHVFLIKTYRNNIANKEYW